MLNLQIFFLTFLTGLVFPGVLASLCLLTSASILRAHACECAGTARPPTHDTAAGPVHAAPPTYPFAIRGRWPTAVIRYRVDSAPPPPSAGHLTPASTRDAVRRAALLWSSCGGPRFIEIEDETADLTADLTASLAADITVDLVIGWRDAAHDDCPAFCAWDGGRAHAGPSAPGTFIHLHRGVPWPAPSPGADPLLATLLHELGHVLGLDHCVAPGAVMEGGYDPTRIALTDADRHGLHALYGGVDAPVTVNSAPVDPCDQAPAAPAVPTDPADSSKTASANHRGPLTQTLVVSRFDRDGALVPTGVVLRGLPCGIRPHAWDLDGDGRDELVLRGPPHGDDPGALVLRFDARCRLVGTIGPLHGVFPARGELHFGRTLGGARLLLILGDDGDTQAIEFPDSLLPVRPWGGGPFLLTDGAADLEGNGRREVLLRAADSDLHRWLLHGSQMRVGLELPPLLAIGDLDGDGSPEAVHLRADGAP